ncbi:MAG: SGNH/GDSL hydrolase family protein [Polyangiaceae bacterium]
MRRSALLVVLASLALACGRAPTEPAAQAPSVDASADATRVATSARYLALGDSFTAGTGSREVDAFPARLADRWRRAGCAVEVTNLAVNGYTTRDVIDYELVQIAGPPPDVVTLAIGANDIVRGVSTADYAARVREIFDRLAQAGIPATRVVTLPQPDWSRSPAAADFGEPAANGARIRELNALLRDLSVERGARYVDLSPRMQAQADAKQLAPDGLHPSREAYDAWAEDLSRALPSPCGG